MNKYNGILKQAADDYRIIKGKSENETDWKSRMIYSILGRMALASLFDMEDEDKSSYDGELVYLKFEYLPPFFNLIKSQFQVQPAVPGKDKDPHFFYYISNIDDSSWERLNSFLFYIKH